MAIIKCKMCGGDIELSADKSYGVCEYCGSTVTLPKVDDEQRAAAFNRGNHFRRIGEFDKALTVYESLVRDNEADAEAHWCCALCRFGIEYVKDPASGEYMPTCHRASFDSFLDDVDTKAAIEHADTVAKRQYEHDAQVIEEVRRGILTLSKNERPYDVFICYKETDDRGQRTIDSQRAQEIYYQLTDQGLRVFFSRITLEDKAGQQYEPYIFAALNSAKVMIVVGTKREHLEAVWVKNEWSRFLVLMKHNRQKLLIPCYADMDPYDMPEQLSVLQGYDMTKIGFIQDLTRGISKVLDTDKKPASVPAVQEQQTMTSNVRALLKRGYMALEDKDWGKANDFFEQVLNQDAECAEAYMGKVLAYRASTIDEYITYLENEHKDVKKEEFFITTDEERVKKAIERWEVPQYLTPFFIRVNYKFKESYKSEVKYWTEAKQKEEKSWATNRQITRARKYATGSYKQELESAYKRLMDFYDGKITEATTRCEEDKKALEQKIAQVNDTADKTVEELYIREIAHRERDYEAACKAYAEVDWEDSKDLERIADCFSKIGDFKDCKKRYDDCIKAIETIREKRYKEEAERIGQERRRKKKRTIICVVSVLSVIVIATVGIFSVQYIKKNNERKAYYANGEALLAEGRKAEAIFAFGKASGYKDAADRSRELRLVSIAAGSYHTVGLRKDGTLRAVGSNSKSQCYLTSWTDIVASSAGDSHTVGLKSDGTVVAKGDNDYGQCDVSEWTDIVAIAAGSFHTVGLSLDGTVVAVGSNRFGQCDVSEWTDIVAISAGEKHTIGLKSDGTVVAVGDNQNHQCDVSEWMDIRAIEGGAYHTIGLRSDGTVVATGNNVSHQCEVSSWTDIKAIAAGERHTVGLKLDGTVVTVGSGEFGQCDVSEWTDIVAIAAGNLHTVGLRSDGTVVTVGSNSHGQRDIFGWTDIVVPE